jgi:hypothetical protein
MFHLKIELLIMHKIALYIVLLFLSLVKFVDAQCFEGEMVFLPGEAINYEVAYNWGIVWVDAGEVSFKTDTVDFRGRTSYYFDSHGKSYGFYNWFFKVDDHFQSWCELNTISPISFQRETSEGGYWVKNKYEFQKDGEVFSSVLHKGKPLRIDTLKTAPCTFDVLSAIYYVRNFDFSNAKSGDEFPVNFIIDGGLYTLSLFYWGKEEIKNRNGKTYPCEKLSVKLVAGTIFKDDEELFVWLIDDKNRIPLMVEAKVLVGSVKAYLTGYKGLKYELSVVLDE